MVAVVSTKVILRWIETSKDSVTDSLTFALVVYAYSLALSWPSDSHNCFADAQGCYGHCEEHVAFQVN